MPAFSQAATVSSSHRLDLHLAYVGLTQQQHAQAALADAAAHGQGQGRRPAASCGRAVPHAAAQPASFQLAAQRFRIDTDTHAGQLQRTAQGHMPEKDVAVQRPVVVVRGAAVVGLAGSGAVPPIFMMQMVLMLLGQRRSRAVWVCSPGYMSSSSWVVIKVTSRPRSDIVQFWEASSAAHPRSRRQHPQYPAQCPAESPACAGRR